MSRANYVIVYEVFVKILLTVSFIDINTIEMLSISNHYDDDFENY